MVGKAKGDLDILSGQFYTQIPHNFGMKNMRLFTIRTLDDLKEKVDLIQNLSDIKIAHQMLKKQQNIAKQNENIFDENYRKLNCELHTIEENDQQYQMINEYLQNTRDGRRLTMMNLYSVNRNGEDKVFNPQKYKNKMLLWHGSRFSNFVGILSQGLRIAPPEAPKTGYLFGKGVYFADMAGKSAPYCCAGLSNGVGLFLICEVAMGNPQRLYDTNEDADILPNGVNSTMCVGKHLPDPKQNISAFGDVIVPKGRVISNEDKKARRSHNEFIVYTTQQCRMRYLCMVRFD